MSQRQATFGDLELQWHEMAAKLVSLGTTLFGEYKAKVSELANQNQQLMADLAKLKVEQTKKEPEPKELKKTNK